METVNVQVCLFIVMNGFVLSMFVNKLNGNYYVSIDINFVNVLAGMMRLMNVFVIVRSVCVDEIDRM